jgi:hypothetical protein
MSSAHQQRVATGRGLAATSASRRATKPHSSPPLTFFLQRPAFPTLRFFAHKQTLLIQLSYDANEKFGVIFTFFTPSGGTARKGLA